MVMIKKCCFCWNTKEGSIASGVYTMIGKVIGVIVIIALLAQTKVLKKQAVKYGLDKDDVGVLRGILIAYLVGCLIFVMFCIFVIYGAVKDRRGFLLPWVIAMSIEVALQLITVIATIVVSAMSKETDVAVAVITILFMIFSIMFQIYCIICVKSHYDLLGQTSSNPPSYAVKM